MNLQIRVLVLIAFGAGCAAAQPVPKALEQNSPNTIFLRDGLSSFSFSTSGRSGKWWTRPEEIERLGLSMEQRKNLSDILQQHRLKLIDLDAALQKEEVTLEPLVSAEQPDDAKVLAQVDRVAQARAELEKANSRMLWQVRRVLTPDQWKQLQTPQPLSRPKLK